VKNIHLKLPSISHKREKRKAVFSECLGCGFLNFLTVKNKAGVLFTFKESFPIPKDAVLFQAEGLVALCWMCQKDDIPQQFKRIISG